MTDHTDDILMLAKSGLPARKISERIGLSPRRVQRIVVEHLGRAKQGHNSAEYQLDSNLRPHIIECLRRLGKDPHLCEICKERQARICDIHHTKYEGATVYDLQYVCRSCNLSWANLGLH